MQPIQKNLCQKLKPFQQNFIPLPGSTLNLQHFEKEIEHSSLSVLEVIGCEKRRDFNA